MPRHNPASVALRALLDALNDEDDAEFQEALDNLSDEIERGAWPSAYAVVRQFLGARVVTNDTSPEDAADDDEDPDMDDSPWEDSADSE